MSFSSFKKVLTIGASSFSLEYEAFNETRCELEKYTAHCDCVRSEKVAVKILDKTKLDAKTQRLLSREMSNMERLHHPNIIRLYEVIETLSKLYLVMEYASCGELYTKISNDGRLPESEARVLFAQIVAAVDHMVSESMKSLFVCCRSPCELNV